jgi:hypothetical protein
MVLQQRLMQRASPSPAPPMVNNNNNQNPMYAQQQQQQQQVYNGYLQQATELDDLLQQQERAEAPVKEKNKLISFVLCFVVCFCF